MFLEKFKGEFIYEHRYINLNCPKKSLFWLREIFWWGCNLEYSPASQWLWNDQNKRKLPFFKRSEFEIWKGKYLDFANGIIFGNEIWRGNKVKYLDLNISDLKFLKWKGRRRVSHNFTKIKNCSLNTQKGKKFLLYQRK